VKSNIILFNILALSIFGLTPAFADKHHQNDGYEKQQAKWQKQQQKQQHKQNKWQNGYHDNRRANFNNWDQEREMYRQRWRGVSRAQQQQYDAQLRAQWLAYHHNNYNGSYSWDTYSDPRFLDYLHNSNPSLLTQLRSVIGF
jgi:hypothetical protein